MTIANAEHEGGDAVAGAGASERVDHMFIPRGIQSQLSIKEAV